MLWVRTREPCLLNCTPALAFHAVDLCIGDAFFAGRADYDRLVTHELFSARRTRELDYARGFREPSQLPGYCTACDAVRHFSFEPPASADEVPNWREMLHCTSCGLFSRIRHAIELASRQVALREARIYLTEQATTLYGWLRRQGIDAYGSEFVSEPARKSALERYIRTTTGDANATLNFEDVTRLTLPDESRTLVLSFDVLEHVPQYAAALREFRRVLAPGGVLLFTVPFDTGRDGTLVRASLGADGNVIHHVEPEYHGDPAADSGCLAFYTFGWNLLDEIRAAGFSLVQLVSTWHPAKGYLGAQLAMLARREP